MASFTNQNFDLYHFTESIEENELIFDHKIKPGKPKTGNAIKILGLYDYPAEITADAKDVKDVKTIHYLTRE